MQVLRPETVRFDDQPWEGVESIVIERSPAREILEFGDLGMHAALVDAPEQRVTISVSASADRAWSEPVSPGAAGELEFVSSFGRTDSNRRRVTVSCVVWRVREQWGVSGAVRTLTLLGVSPDGGASDPVTVEEL